MVQYVMLASMCHGLAESKEFRTFKVNFVPTWSWRNKSIKIGISGNLDLLYLNAKVFIVIAVHFFDGSDFNPKVLLGQMVACAMDTMGLMVCPVEVQTFLLWSFHKNESHELKNYIKPSVLSLDTHGVKSEEDKLVLIFFIISH